MKKWQVFFIELFFFLLTLLLGIFVALELKDVLPVAENGGSEAGLSSFTFLIYFFLVTAIIYFVSKKKNFEKGRDLFFKGAFLLSIGLGSLLTFSVLIHEIWALVSVLILIWIWKKKPVILLHNLLISFSIAGVGAVVGNQLASEIIIIFFALFSVYDFVAVYKTKHMVKMASEMVKSKAIIGFIIPFSSSELLDDFGKKRKEKFMVLGGGDVAFPLFLISATAINYGLREAATVTAFACVGLFGSFILFKIKKRAIPALPPIALACLLGYSIVIFF